MNQILQTSKNKKKLKKILKVQIVMSILGLACVFAFLKTNENDNLYGEHYSSLLTLHSEIMSIYDTETLSYSNIFGKISIPKLGIEYTVFNEFSEDLLKISPCKFYGVEIGEAGNIAIAGHNFDNHTFFSDINKLESGDEIYLYSNDNTEYVYTVYNVYETTDDDLDCLNTNFYNALELTLVTCNNTNQKRVIVKALCK